MNIRNCNYLSKKDLSTRTLVVHTKQSLRTGKVHGNLINTDEYIL
jgi:hypothetical protein